MAINKKVYLKILLWVFSIIIIVSISNAAEPTPSLVGAVLSPLDSLSKYVQTDVVISSPYNIEKPLPDIDLHAYAYDGKHVGVNYTTKVYENEIMGATTNGDTINGIEWIYVPGNIKVQFVVDSRDNQIFLNSLPGLKPNGTQSYNLTIVYALPDHIRYTTTIMQTIQPGTIKKYNYSVLKNIDGTYKVVVMDEVDFNTTASTVATQTPKVRGFSLLVTIVSLLILFLVKRRKQD